MQNTTKCVTYMGYLRTRCRSQRCNPSTPQRRHHLGLLLVLSAFCRIVKGSGGKHYLEHGYHGLDLSADGSFEAVGLTHNQWKNASCSPNGFRDFYIDATSANAHDNLFVEAVHVPTDENDVKLESLGLNMYFEEIPADRITENARKTAPDGVYSLAVNANEIKEGRYFIAVQCDEIEDAKFGILAKFETAELHEGVSHPYFICSKETLYHYLDLSANQVKEAQHNVRFELCAPADSLSELTLVTKVHYPPLRIAEPKKILSAADANTTSIVDDSVCTTFDICNPALEEGKVWAGVFGGGLCGKYNLTATCFGGVNHTDETCSTDTGGESIDNPASSISLEHVYRGSCGPYEWVDYELYLNDYDRSNNIVFEVTDQNTGSLNPRSLSVHLFTDAIPGDRLTENRADESVSAIYAVFKTFLSLSAMTNVDGSPVQKVFVSVRCGPTATRFKLLGEHVTAGLLNHHPIRGEVCSGAWVFHYMAVPLNANVSSTLHVKVDTYEGHVDFTVLGSYPPIRIAPPYGISSRDNFDDSSSDSHRRLSSATSNSTEVSNEVTVCDAEPGITYYIGVKVSDGYDGHCAVYDIEATLKINDIQGCEAPRQSAPDHGFQPVALTAHVPVSDTVESGKFRQYSIEIDEDHAHDNLVVEAELLVTTAGSDSPDAIELMLFAGELPLDGNYKTQFFAQKGKAGLWSVGISAHDLKQMTYHIVVKGTDVGPVRFRVVALLIESELVLGHRHHSEICESEWVYYTFNALSLNSSSSSSSLSSSHRRRLANANTRSLLESSNDDKGTTHGSQAVHLSVHVWRYSGSFYTRIAHGYAPIKLVPPFTFVGSETDDIYIHICDVGLHDGVAETAYIGLLGGQECALFDVVAHSYVGGNCTETRNFAIDDPVEGAMELQLEHFTYSSCTPGGFTDHFITISEDHSHDNLVFEVEAVGDATDPTALSVFLHEESIPPSRESERRSESSTDGIYSVAVSSVDVHTGTYFLSVKCKAAGISASGGGGSERVRFRVAPLAIARDLVVGHTQHGELCPLEWIHHRFVLDDLSTIVNDDDGHRRALAEAEPYYHVRIHFWKYTGDFFAMVSDHPPFKLMAPYSYMEFSEHELVLDFCDLHENDEVWVGLYGGDVCSVYDADIQVRTGSCTNTAHEDSDRRRLSESSSTVDVIAATSATEMQANKLYLSHCKPDSWVDFAIRVGDTNSSVDPESSNIIFEVLVNQASKTNPTALSMYLHLDGHLPDQRDDTEVFSTTATNGILSVSVPAGLVASTTSALFLSVRCGDSAVRFKTVALVLKSDMVAEEHNLGEVCPNNWVYYHIPRQEGDAANVRFDVTKYEGSLSLIARSEERPMRLTYPYVPLTISNEEETTSVYGCDLSVGDELYLGVKGGSDCSSFSVTPHFFDGDCSDETNAEHTVKAQEDTTVELINGAWQFGHCARGGWSSVSFSQTFHKYDTVDNVLIEIEVLSDDGVSVGSLLDPTAISVYLFDGSAPPDTAEREIEGAYLTHSLASQDGMHNLFQSYVEVNKLIASLDSDAATKAASVAVKCSDAREMVRFRVMMHTIHAHLELGHVVHGQTCANGWVYHYIDLTSTTAHRQRRLGETSSDKTKIANEDEERTRSLGAASSSSGNIRVSFRLLQGGVYQLSTRLDNPPTFTSHNRLNLELMAGSDPDSTIALGHVVEYSINICGAGGHKNYVGVFGDESGCALYDIKAEAMADEEECIESASRVVEV